MGEKIISVVPARIGILGNPSDGFRGKTMACTIKNYQATVILMPIIGSPIELIPNPRLDNIVFDDLNHLHFQVSSLGMNGGQRLFLACLKKFRDLAIEKGWNLKRDGFKVSYETTIPRQVGLSGSSALLLALTTCLIEFYKISEEMFPLSERPKFLLTIEVDELGIHAGLMDRVVQVYQNCVYMDFKDIQNPVFETLDDSAISKLNQLECFLLHLKQDRESGKMHNNVKQRYIEGDLEVTQAMVTFGNFAKLGSELLKGKGDFKMNFGKLLNANFDLRRKIYGDSALGQQNIEMIELVRSLGGYCKFCGSGGSIYGFFFPSNPQKMLELKKKANEKGLIFLKVAFG